MNTLQTLISLGMIIYVLAVIVQAVQEFIKKVLGTKADVMEDTVEKFMGQSLTLPQVQGALQKRGLNITALEGLSKEDFRHLLDGIEFAAPQLEGIVKTGEVTTDKIKDNIAGSYEAFRAAFQQEYAKRNKVVVLVISFLVIFALNANLLVLYEQVSTDQAVQQALVGKAAQLGTDSSPAGNKNQSSQDLIDSFKSTRGAITKDLRDNPIVVRTSKYKADFEEHPYGQIPGLLIMGFLVSLGAPFWNDVLKGVTGLNNTLNSDNRKSS